MYGVWCKVSGGVTGTRESWLKEHGVRYEVEDRALAERKAFVLTEQMNANPHRTASFSYRAMALSTY